MDKLLITGSSGMVGRNLIEHLRNEDYHLLVPTSKELNLLDTNATLKFVASAKPDLIIHCAGIVGGIQANILNPVKFMVENTEMGKNIIQGARESGVANLINLGSSCMYPRDIPNPIKESDILTGKLEPTNEGYALAKIFAARLCAYINCESSKFNYKTIIPCNLYGKWDKFDPEHSHMVPAVIRKIHHAKEVGEKTVEIWGDGTIRREFMYTEDLADFIKFGIKRFDQFPDVVNVGIGHDFTINEYYDVIKKIVGFEGQFSYDLSKPTGVKQKLVDISAQREMGWTPSTTLEEGIRKTYNFFLEEIHK